VAIAIVQGTLTAEAAATTVSKGWGNTPTSGNLLIAFGIGTNAITNSSLSGWTRVVNVTDTSGGKAHGLWYKIAGTAEGTVTLNWSSSTSTLISLREYSGIDATPFDKAASINYTSGGTSKNSGTTGTTTVNDELLIAMAAFGNSISSLAWSNSFTNMHIGGVTNAGWASKIVATTGAYDTTATWVTTRQAGACIATFKGASTAGGSVTPASGSQTQTGNSPNVYAAYNVTAVGGSQSQTSNIPAVYAGYNQTPTGGAQTQNSTAAIVNAAYNVTPASGSQTQSGNPATGTFAAPASISVTPASGSQTQTSIAALVNAGYNITPAAGSQTQTSTAALVNAKYNVTPASGSQLQTGDAATGTFTGAGAISVTPASGQQTQTGSAATGNAAYNATPASGSQSQTGNAATGNAACSVTPASGSQSQTQDLPSVFAAYIAAFIGGLQTQTGDAATGSFAFPAYSVTPVGGTQSQAGDSPAVNAGYVITPLSGVQLQTMGEITAQVTRIGASTYIILAGAQRKIYAENETIDAAGNNVRAGENTAITSEIDIIRSKA